MSVKIPRPVSISRQSRFVFFLTNSFRSKKERRPHGRLGVTEHDGVLWPDSFMDHAKGMKKKYSTR
jgi:hypothetical protein